MSKTAIIKSGESYFIKQLSLSKPIQLDQVIFANIPNINSNTNIDLNGKMPPPNQIMHKSPITQAGLLNDRTVVYSIVLDTNVGDFSFNYIGLMNAETNTLCVVMHTDLTRKHKTVGQQQGNTLTESIWLEIDNASESTGIIVNAETWQIDYSKRLAGEDERIRLTNYDLYNRLVIKTGMNITKKAEQLTVNSGLAYVAGLRVNHVTPKTIKVENNQSLYIDCWLAGTTTGEWITDYNLIAGTNLKDYEKSGRKHYVERIASIDESGNLNTITPSGFITTLDLAATIKTGIVKLNSSTNSTSETEAATPLAVKKVSDRALIKYGDTMTGNLAIANGDSSAVLLRNNKNEEYMLRIHRDGSFSIVNKNNEGKWVSKFRNEATTNMWRFENTDDVTISGKSILKTGDGGLLSYTQTIKDVFASDLKTGFYRFDTNSINTPYKGLGYFNKISWNANESVVIAYLYNSNRVFTGYKDKSTGEVKYSELLKPGDYGIGAPTGIPIQNLDEHLNSGFYGTNTAKIPNLPFSGGGSAASLLVLPTESPYWKVEQLSVVDGRIPKIYYRTDTRNDGKQAWYEAITTANINDYLPVGIPQPWPTTTPPDGWLKCNGWKFDKNKYPKLAKAYPSGYLPEIRGETIRGWDDGRGVDPGRQILSWQGDATRNVVGKFVGSPLGDGSDVSGAFYLSGTYSNGHLAIGQTKWKDRAEYVFDASRIVPTANENRVRSIAFLYIVKAE